jgi:hypothetical protein
VEEVVFFPQFFKVQKMDNNPNPYAQRPDESTQAWLRRLISIGAPADIRANVQAILESETRQSQPQPGKYYFL